MANMSYCQFRNTAGDLRDCVEAMEDMRLTESGEWVEINYDEEGEEGKETTLSAEECGGLERLATYAARFLEIYNSEVGNDRSK